MLRGLIGSEAITQRLKGGLQESTLRTQQIAHRVSNAFNSVDASFESALEEANATDAEAVDLEAEMVALSSETIRYEAIAEVLHDMYAQIRSSIRGA